MTEQISFEHKNDDFASNPEPRCPCLLLLDVSGSMRGHPIDELNAGLNTFKEISAPAIGNAPSNSDPSIQVMTSK